MTYTPPAGDNLSLSLYPFSKRPTTSLTLYVDDHGPGVITGRVTDTTGDPVENVIVEAIDQNGTSVEQTTTDAYGEYRLFVSGGGTFHVLTRNERDTRLDQSSVSVPESVVDPTA